MAETSGNSGKLATRGAASTFKKAQAHKKKKQVLIFKFSLIVNPELATFAQNPVKLLIWRFVAFIVKIQQFSILNAVIPKTRSIKVSL